MSAALVAAGAIALPAWFSGLASGQRIVLSATMTALLLLGLALFMARWASLPLMRRPEPMAAPAGLRVGVATTFVSGAEDIGMLEETVRAIVAMDYPHETWVLDEGDDPAVRALCARTGARHFSRRHRPEYQKEHGVFEARTKHGNYNAWLHEVAFERYDAVVGFDPDHVPQRRFLLETLGYLADPRVGYVQAPQTYYNQSASFIARGAAEETYAYYSSIQMSAYRVGYPIVTGCHNVHRKAALRSIGGFAAHEADDLLITLHYRAQGWDGVYVPQPLAQGLTPVDWSSYLIQQRRWARSVLDIKLRLFPRLAANLPRSARVTGALHGLYYLHGLAAAAGLAVLALLLVTPGTPGVIAATGMPRLSLLLGSMLVTDLYRQRFFLDRRRECGLHWRATVLRLAKWPFTLLGLLDVLRRRRVSYSITAKTRQARRGRSPLTRPHALVVATVSCAWLVGELRGAIASPVLHAGAAAVVLTSIGVVATLLLRFPPPYDPAMPRPELRPGLGFAGRQASGRRAAAHAPDDYGRFTDEVSPPAGSPPEVHNPNS